ncbi:WG repeat-containing protein [Fluviicola chungangensis]|uniref:WG repeat-containing protein n=1 Tax=Fluviicola chungangensis TaxID=2597671 RepID=A0A556N6W7_9FLAO|nr:WG repeat-containing protein [Fluviicola chungangensis]TSJ47924.1 WG repeat-containing protein [Fluviicola chungangensis]
MIQRLFTIGALILSSFLAQAQIGIVQVKPVGSRTWGYAGIDGKMIIPAEYDKTYPFSSNGLAITYNTKDRQHHFIDAKNKVLNTEEPKFKIKEVFGFGVKGFQDELIPVQVGSKWGYMNTFGKMAVPAVYDDANDFDGGFAAVKKGAQFLVIDTKGAETAIASPALDVRDFSEGLAPIRATDKKFGFINTKGEMVIPAQFESVGYFVNGIAWAKTFDKKVGYIDKTGKWIIEAQFDVGKEFDAKSGLALVRTGDQWFYVNAKGTPLKVTDTESWGNFSEGLAEGKKGVLKGFYDTKGVWVIQPQFEDVRDFHNGYAAAKLNGKWGLIDKTGKWKMEPQFEQIKDVVLIKK